MKITCAVEVIERSDPEGDCLNKVNYELATLALCNKTRSNVQSDKNFVLIMCTREKPEGTKYKIRGNAFRISTIFLNDGKCSIKFTEPPHDINLSNADPLQLKGFIHAIRLLMVGQGTGKIHFSPPPTKVDQPEKLTIRKVKDMKSGFPRNLTWLQIYTGCLKKIDNNILKLEHLQVLDLRCNSIKELPLALADLRLKELLVAANKLKEFPKELSTGALGQNLEILDLTCNEISSLSPYFCLMKNLSVLSLGFNKLQAFPRNMHCLESLNTFCATHNQLKSLPFGITELSLHTLNLFFNPLDIDIYSPPDAPWKIPTLKEHAAAAIVTEKVPYSAEDLPASLLDYLVEHSLCSCGRKVFQEKCINVLVLHHYNEISSEDTIYVSDSSLVRVPLEASICSSKCWYNI